MFKNCGIHIVAFMLVACLVVVCGCSGMERLELYRAACDMVKADPGFPRTATLFPSDKCKIFAGKSASSVEIFFDGGDGAGKEPRSYTVWLKRYGDRWVADRCYLTPTYPVHK